MRKNNSIISVTDSIRLFDNNFVSSCYEKHQNYPITNLSTLTSATNFNNVIQCRNIDDTYNEVLNRKLFENCSIPNTICFTTQNYVNNSISYSFINTNSINTFSLLEIASHYSINKSDDKNFHFHSIPKEQVYDALSTITLLETIPSYILNRSNLLSIIHSYFLLYTYHYTFGMNLITMKASNNYESKQYCETLLSNTIKQSLNKESISLYSKNENLQDPSSVLTHCKRIPCSYYTGNLKKKHSYSMTNNNQRIDMLFINTISTILGAQKSRVNDTYIPLLTLVIDSSDRNIRYISAPTQFETETG